MRCNFGPGLGSLLPLLLSTPAVAHEPGESPAPGCSCCCCFGGPTSRVPEDESYEPRDLPREESADRKRARSKEKRGKRVSLTISPLHLVFPILELAAEVRALPHLGTGLIVGAGKMTVETVDPTGNEERVAVAAQELGGYAALYPFDPFQGLHLGAEMQYMEVDTEELDGEVKGPAEGLAMGPFIGYKAMTKIGLTIIAQAGAQYVLAQTKTNDSSGDTANGSTGVWTPLLNLNLGWSF